MLRALSLQSEVAANGTSTGSTAAEVSADGLAGKLNKIRVGTGASQVNGTTPEEEAAAKSSKAAKEEVAPSVGGSFLKTLISSDFYKNTKVCLFF